MYCDACGARLEDGQSFCRTCGKGVGTAPVARVPTVPPPVNRVAAHLRVLAVLWIARAVLLLIPGLFLLVFTRGRFPSGMPEDMQGFLHPLLGGIAWVMMFGAAACFIAAWGLLERAPWARIFTIIIAAISLVEVPFGTVLGIYSLWVLLPESSEAEYRAMAMP
jgi:hypothetical protein